MQVSHRFFSAAVAISCGLLLALSGTNFDLWPLAWIAWAPVMAVALNGRIGNAALYGFLSGFAAYAGSCYWLIPYLQRFANLSRSAAILIFLVVVSYQAIAWALFCFVLRHLLDRTRVPVTFLAPVLFVAIEFAMPNIFGATLAITQAWVPTAIQIAEITGPLGVSFLLMLGNAALYDVARAWRTGTRLPLRSLTAAIGVLAACLLFGMVRIQQVRAAREAAPKLTVGVVQANVGTSSKGPLEDAHQRLFAHQQASTRLELAGANLIVWPELAYPYEFRRDQQQDRLLGDLRRVRAGVRTPVIFGAVTVDADSLRRYNSVLLLDRTDDVRGRYDKNIPLIVSAHIPFYARLPFIRRWVPDTNRFERGTDVTLLSIETKAGTVNIAPTIGFEDTLPSVGRRLARLNPNLIVNLSNDVW